MRQLFATILLCLFFGHFRIWSQEKLYSNTFALEDVTLLEGPFKHARDLNIEVLLQYNMDRLLAPYRKEAGLEPRAPGYRNWEGLAGHVGGHYLSALAMNYASTGEAVLKTRIDYMVAELSECQAANTADHADWGAGYLGGVPNSAKIWRDVKKGNLEAYKAAWVPWYNLHKMYAGLRDAWLYADNEEAKTLFLNFCDWGIDLTRGLTENDMQRMLDTEHGGINESYADAYQMTGDQKYLEAARRFSHKALLDPLAAGEDNLDNKHANTQVPKFVGFERIAELDGDSHYSDAATFFWQTIIDHRTLAFGGNSRKEHFPSVEASSDYITEADGPETCNSYNMLKLTEDLFRDHPEAKYVDYYEKTLFNHILSTQHPVHGGYVYFTAARPRHYRVYSAPNEAMWCCVGTGMENHSKYNQFIFTHSGDSLFVNLFVSAKLHWKDKNIEMQQETGFPESERATLRIKGGEASFALKIRYPGWVADGSFKITVNGEEMAIGAHPSSYVSLYRKWKAGDVIEMYFPMKNSVERLPYLPQYVAFFHGPILLGARTGTEDLKGLIADDSRFGQHTTGKKLPIGQAPVILEDDVAHIANKLKPVGGKPLHFTLDATMVHPIEATLEPFYQIHDSRYMMYWLALSGSGYRSYLDSLALVEREHIALESRSTDFVATGEQQPESDHLMEMENSVAGNSNDAFWREARDGGYFSYEMKTNGENQLHLWVSYWGFEWGQRKFEIYLDDRLLAQVDNTDRWKIGRFRNQEYAIPGSLLKGRKTIRVKFKALRGGPTSAIYGIRLVKPN